MGLSIEEHYRALYAIETIKLSHIRTDIETTTESLTLYPIVIITILKEFRNLKPKHNWLQSVTISDNQ